MRLIRFGGKAAIAVLLLSGCLDTFGSGESDEILELRHFTPRGQPDDLSASPTKPLELPESVANLPLPDKSVANRSDLTPIEDTIAALGGNVDAAEGRPDEDDMILMAYAGRAGRDMGIRQTLAQEDLEFRKDTNVLLLDRLVKQNVYNEVYDESALDPYDELIRFRDLGIATPPAPPEGWQRSVECENILDCVVSFGG